MTTLKTKYNKYINEKIIIFHFAGGRVKKTIGELVKLIHVDPAGETSRKGRSYVYLHAIILTDKNEVEIINLDPLFDKVEMFNLEEFEREAYAFA